jgi:uncharacterized protein (DUF736 family)
MMANQYDNNMTGIISKNDRKEKDSHPDYRGQAEVDGVEYWISAWIKERKDGSGKFLSMRFETKDQQANKTTTTTTVDADAPF